MTDRPRRPFLLLAVLLGLLTAASPTIASDELDLERRIAARRAVEKVYWTQRIWPVENQGNRPTFDETLSRADIRFKVIEALSKTSALKRLWSYDITHLHLQAEMNRMARSSQAPDVLVELFEVLGNDPDLIAETLARPIVADRLIRHFYKHDERIHGEVRRRAERAVLRHGTIESMPSMGDEYIEIEYVLQGEYPETGDRTLDDPRQVRIDRDRWNDVLLELGKTFGVVNQPDRMRTTPHIGDVSILPHRLPVNTPGPLAEDDRSFTLSAILQADASRIRVAKAVWAKRSFESWWHEVSHDLPLEFALPAAEYSLPLITASACGADSWAPIRSAFPYTRDDHSAIWTGSEMIVWGGDSPAGRLNTGEQYSPATDSWIPVPVDTATPTPRSGHTAVWTGQEMIVWGGMTVGATEGGRYDLSTGLWATVSSGGDAPSARSGHSAVWTGQEMIIWGGDETNSGGRYDPDSDSWSPIRTDATTPSARSGHTAVWTGSEMIVWGGYRTSSFCLGPGQDFPRDGGRYDPDSDSWTPTPSLAGQGRAGHTAVWTGQEMIVWGGYWQDLFDCPFVTTILHNSGERYDPVANGWTATGIDSATPIARESHSSVWTGSEMIVWGGSTGQVPANTGGRYDPASDTWTRTLRDSTTPADKAGHTAVWTGSEMIVWSFGTGGRYDPASDSWQPTMDEIVPEGRAVWTGSEMIVWGFEAAGARYQPATDSWMEMNSFLGPRFRNSYRVLWTGSKMIAWGDPWSSGSTNTGGRYDPATDVWQLISSVGEPSERHRFTAVWTGSEMIVWGGTLCCGIRYNDGGRYDPVSDTWSSMRNDVTTPEGRTFHTAIWTGQEMVIWGGNGDEAPFALNSGGRYDPMTDTWTPTDLGAATPEGRYFHTTAWTGSEMVVWGGFDGTYLNTGGLYDPVSDTWVDTTTVGSPEARYRHSAIWTGTEMILWGGIREGGPSFMDTGARFDPGNQQWTPTAIDGMTPLERADHEAVWTGSRMLVWGGTGPGRYSALNTGGAYCTCASATYYFDFDGDGFGNSSTARLACTPPANFVPVGGDCDDAEGTVWSLPGETRDLTFGDAVTLTWSPPTQPGTSSVYYDLLRSTNAADFHTSTVCVVSDTPDEFATDAGIPGLGAAYFYLSRAVNGCPGEDGLPGHSSSGQPRTGRTCP